MGKTAAEVLLDVLAAYGVSHLFGIPGDAIDPLMEAIRRDRRVLFVQVRHEEAGAFMASALAKRTGRLAACLGTAGPGAIHLLNGLYDAKMDHAPVLALTGQVSTVHLGTDYFQEVNLVGLFADVALYNQQVSAPDEMAAMALQACRTAVAQRGVAHLSLPFDLLQQPAKGLSNRSAVSLMRRDAVPVGSLLDEAGEILSRAERPVILAGAGSLSARTELEQLAGRLQAPIVYTLPAKGVLPDRHPLILGGLGLLGAQPAHEAMESTDVCLMVGTQYPYLEFLPSKATMVQIDWDASQIGKRHPVDVALVGTSGATLRALAERVPKRAPSPYLERLQEARQRFLAKLDRESMRRDRPINPFWVARCLSRVVEDDANVAVDVGNALVWTARAFEMRRNGWLVSAWLGSMGFGMPAAIAAKLTEPAKQSVAVVGDGGFAMLMADFVTAVKYDWPIVVVVLNNHRLAMIKFEQESAGYPEFGTRLTNPDFAAYAESAGGRGIRVTDPDDLEQALQTALSTGRPTVVDVECSPDERPLPPRITSQQAYGYATALFKETFHL